MSFTDVENKLVKANDIKAKLEEEADATSLSLESITDGQNERVLPAVRFLDNLGSFADQFTPPASPELLIGAYLDIFSKFTVKAYKTTLNQRSEFVVMRHFAFTSMDLANIQALFVLLVCMRSPHLLTKDSGN
jgi:hypothetical protein